MPAGKAALADVIVLDFTRAVSGPLCTMLLGDLGARVIKVEEPGTGDETRSWGPPFIERENGERWGTYFVSINRNKESIALDLKSAKGRDVARRLARRADVVVENFRPGVAERLGIGYEALRAVNPALIYCSISGFGQTGPWRERPGYDLMIQALSGLMHMSAEPGGRPVKSAFPVADVLTGLFAEQAILAALHAGRGQRIEVSLLDSLLAAMAPLATAYLMTGEEPPQMGVAQANIVPYQVFRCADGYVAAGAPNDRLFERFARALGHPEWAADARFATNPERTRHRAELVGEVEAALAKLTVAGAVARFEAEGLPCAPVSRLSETLEHPAVAAGVVDFGVRTMAHPARFSVSPVSYRHPPRLGEHTESILAWLEETSDGE
jgi:crotonobetainyl-CoA:carnitine CoA-transferase CaiB-like acyl-CoA transferase